MKLLTRGNAKTQKGERKGYVTFIMHLAPASLSGRNVCASSSAGCRAACLNTAGRAQMFTGKHVKDLTGAQLVKKITNGSLRNRIHTARIARTKLYFENRDVFLSRLITEIENGIKWAEKHNLIPVFRLNGTSDVRWESVPVTVNDVEYANVMNAFASIQFYDYTKHVNRKNLPSNYHLTFSRSETNDADCDAALKNGMNVAVVFRSTLPSTYKNHPVVNGDDSDLRFLDPKNVIVGLKSKGKGKKDTTGFVVEK